MLPITPEDINYAEQILFRRTGVFGQQAIDFIQQMNTCDLQAVPGSGKTTALLAKLLIIERYLPLPEDRAILVISHTNAAVDEIRNAIAIYCPKLFSGNHFIGTIQAFVDRFLAFPYYQQRFKRKPARIDDDLYREKAARFSKFFVRGIPSNDQRKAKGFLYIDDRAATIRLAGTLENLELVTQINGNPTTIAKPPGWTRQPAWTVQEISNVKRWIQTFKFSLMEDGYLSYDDAYFLANCYLQEFPAIITVLQQRFKFLFVDEMQDMATHQVDLMEQIFTTGAAPSTIFQRIGDKNQAIYSDVSQQKANWADRPLLMQLTDSQRLSAPIGIVVERLALNPIAVTGRRVNADGSPITLLPHLLIYTDATIEQVLPRYAQLIEQYRNSGQLPTTANQTYKAICWNTKDNPPRKTLSSFFPCYNKARQQPKITYDCLDSYLYLFDISDPALKAVSKNLGNALLRLLRMADVKTADGRSYTKQTLYEYLQSSHSLLYQALRENLYNWSIGVLQSLQQQVLMSIQQFIPQLLSVFGKDLQNPELNGFVTTKTAVTALPANLSLTNGNFFTTPDFSIEVTTVHAVKGQTHTTTLYLESYYQKSVAGAGNYESERLSDFLLGQRPAGNLHSFVEQSMKMAYVGFSRPTHLLCFAVHQDRFNARLNGLPAAEWHTIQV